MDRMEVTNSTNHILLGLDPLFHSYVKIFIGMLRQLKHDSQSTTPSVPLLKFHPSCNPRPIRLVNIAGVIIYAAQHRKFNRFLIDDGSGVVRGMIWVEENKNTHVPHVRLGDFASFYGRLEWQNHSPTVVITTIRPLSDPHAELLWWNELETVYDSVYSKPFDLKLNDTTAASCGASY